MSDVKIRPLADKIIVKPTANDVKTESGIIIPDVAKEKPQRGVVIAAGPGKKGQPSFVKEGDAILYEKNAGMDIKIDENNYLIMRESDILAIL